MNRYLTPGCKTVILINGIPASGKSTVTRQLSAAFNLPQLTIDGIKEPFMACFTGIDRSFNRQLGCAAYEVIWSIVGQSPAGCIWLIDAWFGFQPRDTLQQLLQQAGVEKVLEVWLIYTLLVQRDPEAARANKLRTMDALSMLK